MPDGGFWSDVWKISPLLGGGLLALIGLVAYGATRLLVQRYLKELRDKLKAAAAEVNMPVSVFLRIVLSRIVKQS